MDHDSMNENEAIKAAVPVVCPQCSHTMIVELSLGADLLSENAAAEIIKNMKSNDTPQAPTAE